MTISNVELGEDTTHFHLGEDKRNTNMRILFRVTQKLINSRLTTQLSCEFRNDCNVTSGESMILFRQDEFQFLSKFT